MDHQTTLISRCSPHTDETDLRIMPALPENFPAQVFACTVGQKPSKAPYYVKDTSEVALLLQKLAHTHSHGQGQSGTVVQSIGGPAVHALQAMEG